MTSHCHSPVFTFIPSFAKRAVAALLLAYACLPGNAAAEQGLVLVENGVSRAPIIVPAGTTPHNLYAAGELAEYIEKISGARPELIQGQPATLPETAIWVGYQPVLDELFPAIDFDFEHHEEILLAANGNHLVIAGRDRWTPDTIVEEIDSALERGNIKSSQLEYGTANAVYTFLQDQLGVRWIWPGELGEDIIEQDSIIIEPFVHRHHPNIRSRAGMFTYYRHGRGHSDGHNWARHQRVQLDSLSSPAGHGFVDWWERFGESNPEYFALQPDGSRGNYPSARTVKMCLSNPDVWEQKMRDIAAELEADPNKTAFNIAENDGWTSGYCVCENCVAWDHTEGEMRRYVWDGLVQEYVPMSDRQVTFANKVAKMLKEAYPDREYYVAIGAYGHSRPAPLEAVPDDNVLIFNVANFFTRPNEPDPASKAGQLHRDQFSAWGEVAPNLFWRPNKARHMASMPAISVPQAIEDMRFVADKGTIGVFIDTIWGHWATRGPMYYALAQMAWDPQQDGDALMEDYYQRGFGAAAEPIQAYWDLLEETFWKSQEAKYDYPELYDSAFFAAAYEQLDAAAAAVADQPEKYRQRVAFVRTGLDYTRLVTEARNNMIRYDQSGKTDTATLDRARQIWVDEITALTNDERYPFALNWRRMNPGHGHSKRDVGVLYPQDLNRAFTIDGKLLEE